MSPECGECGASMHGEHKEQCSRYPKIPSYGVAVEVPSDLSTVFADDELKENHNGT